MLNLNTYEIEYRCEFNGYNYRFIDKSESGVKVYRHKVGDGEFSYPPSVEVMDRKTNFIPLLLIDSRNIMSFSDLTTTVENVEKYIHMYEND